MSGRALDAKRTATLSVWVAGGLSLAIMVLASTLAANKLLTVFVRSTEKQREPNVYTHIFLFSVFLFFV